MDSFRCTTCGNWYDKHTESQCPINQTYHICCSCYRCTMPYRYKNRTYTICTYHLSTDLNNYHFILENLEEQVKHDVLKKLANYKKFLAIKNKNDVEEILDMCILEQRPRSKEERVVDIKY